MKCFLWSILLLLLDGGGATSIQITEFLASNNNGIQDFAGKHEDWIELYNAGNTAVDLASYSLTDDADTTNQWTFPPNTILEPGAYLIVFASDKAGQDTGRELHTNFKLGASGEYLGLFDPNGIVLTEFRPQYPPQTTDQSFGFNAAGDAVFFAQPTPGSPNGLGRLPPVAFSHPRGFVNEPFSLELSTQSTSTVVIRYTLDGSVPTTTTGIIYEDGMPIPITSTTVVRAASFGIGGTSDDAAATITHTYIFLAHVIQQSAEIPGFPNGRSVATRIIPDEGRVPIDFAMDPKVVTEYRDEIIPAMLSIPTMALTSSLEDMFGENGFYFGEDVEKMVSMEVFYPNTGGATQQLMVGVESHSHNRLKRALRLNFRSDYGNREWETSIFKDFAVNGESATNKVRRLVLRSGNNRCWARSQEVDATSYTEDQFYRDTQIAMSGYGSHGSYVHLYLNGVYEGLYNLVERPDDTFGEAYFGGDDDDWFFTNHDNIGSKDSTRWKYLTESLVFKKMDNSDNYVELQQYLNVTAFADYLILNFYFGMTDWPHKNWYVIARNAQSDKGPTGAMFVGWDGELTLDRRQDRTRTGATIQEQFLWEISLKTDITNLWHAVRKNQDFMDMFYERVTLHTGTGGALSVGAAMERWNRINAFVDSAIIGESARWGDSLVTLGGKFAITRTRNVDFRNQVAKIRNLLEINTQQFQEEIGRLDDCQGLLSVIPCLFLSTMYWIADFLGVLKYFYR